MVTTKMRPFLLKELKYAHKINCVINCLLFFWLGRCLKITEKVSFNIASEASYLYILSGQKLIKNAKIGQLVQVFEYLKLAVK